MSGSDQSARLQGLLSGIADSVGELGAGGDWTSNAIRTVNRPDFMAGSDKVLGKYGRPEFDMNNVDNLDAMANWASRNGYEDQAKQYMALSYQLKEKGAQEAKDAALGKTMAEATQASSAGQLLGAGGDLGGVDATIAVLNKRLSDPEIQKNPMAVEALQREIATLQSQRPDFEAKNVQAIAQGVAKMDQNIAALNQDDPDYAIKKANFEAARSRFLEQSGVEEAYEGNKLKLMELNNQKMDAMWKAQSPAIIAEMVQKAAKGDLDGLQKMQNKYPQFAPQIMALEPDVLDRAERRAETQAADFKFENLGPRIEADLRDIEESDLPAAIKKEAIRLLNGAKNALPAGGINPRTAIDSYNTAMVKVDQLFANEAAAKAGVERQRTERAVVRAEGARVAATKGPSVEAVKSLVEFNTGETWEDLSKDSVEAQKLYDAAEAELTAPLLEYWERANIDAGLEPPNELDDQDIRTIKAEFQKESKAVRDKGGDAEPYDVWAQRKAYELAAKGYDKDSVLRVLRQDTQLSLADANSYYDAIMADIEVNDARITELVKQARSNPSATGSVATAVYQETVKQRQRGNRTVDPNAVSDDYATRTRALLSDPSNRFQGVTLSPFENKLANAYAKANAGNGFRYPSIAEIQPISSSNRRQ